MSDVFKGRITANQVLFKCLQVKKLKSKYD